MQYSIFQKDNGVEQLPSPKFSNSSNGRACIGIETKILDAHTGSSLMGSSLTDGKVNTQTFAKSNIV